MFMRREYAYGARLYLWTRDGLEYMTCMLWCVLHGQWTQMARARVRLPSDGYAGAPGPFGLGGNYVWYLWCTSFGQIATVQCCDKL
ncbi:hypothetical protein M6B38_113605 [Iris pallida]|uniref:Uncharacterized protein n=1 Tax=Iris pallida TaxID=29817 RepID=A0AAX6IKZ5_IRIPA|nr:hypothetical protein M6B38_113605 [Iris pallida]